MATFLEWAIPVSAVVLVVGLPVYAIIIYNDLIHFRENCYKAFANIDVLLKQRHDELPKLVEVCEQYQEVERSLLTELTQIRSAYDATHSRDERVHLENRFNRSFDRFKATVEAYPDLKSNANFMALMQRISGVETEIAARRELFNDHINIYNIQVGIFPELLIARLFGFEPRRFLKVPAG